jgi:Flp pilus assembly protein CpaB
MPTTAFGDAALGRSPGEIGRTRRTVGSRALPSGRAALGGLLITVAALGAFLAATQLGKGRGVTFFVARRDLPAGSTLVADDITTQTATLPPDLIGQVFSQRDQLLRATLKGPLQRGEIFQPGNVIAGAKNGPATRQVPVSVESASAGGGLLQQFDTADVIATFGNGDESFTRLVATNLPVVFVSRSNDKLGSTTGRTTVIFAIDDPRLALQVADANARGKLLLVRTTGAAPASRSVLESTIDAATAKTLSLQHPDATTTTAGPSTSLAKTGATSPANTGAGNGR